MSEFEDLNRQADGEAARISEAEKALEKLYEEHVSTLEKLESLREKWRFENEPDFFGQGEFVENFRANVNARRRAHV